MGEWHQLLRDARESEHLSREALGRVAGVSPQTVKSYELALRNPSRDTMVALLDALKVDRLVRNEILVGAGFAPDGDRLGPVNEDYMLTLEEAVEMIQERRWPAHVNNEMMEVLAANDIAQRMWDVDLTREYNTPVERNILSVATAPRFADRVANWDEMMSVGIGILKGHHRGPETMPEGVSQYFSAVLQRLFEGDPKYIQRFLTLWERIDARVPKVRWFYPVLYNYPGIGQMRFSVLVSPANDEVGLYFNDWIPEDAESYRVLDEIRSLAPRPDRPDSRAR